MGRLGAKADVGGKFQGELVLFQQHPRPLARGLSRRPCSAAYGLGPSVFTLRAKEVWHGSGKGLRVVGETA